MSAPASSVDHSVVIDTNVLLYDPRALHHFAGQDLVLPITVIEEIDRFKKDLNDTGRNARTVSRMLDGLRAEGSLQRGVPLPNGSRLRVSMGDDIAALPEGFGDVSNDNRILGTVLALGRRQGFDKVSLITRDTNMRIKADALGLQADDYNPGQIEADDCYTGVGEASVSAADMAGLYQRGWLPFEPDAESLPTRVFPNQFLVLRRDDDPGTSALARYDAKQERLRLVGKHKEGVWGIFARNKEQRFALDLLLDESISLVTLDGMAGTGKTLLAIACGLRLALDEHRYRRLVVSRPIFPLGRDIGFLPGDISEKLNPWMKPVFDNLELLVGNSERHRHQGRNGRESAPDFQPLLDQGLIQVEPLTYIRGRSLPHQYLIVDEAQNLTPHEVKTVLTRAGEGTKVVFTGDPQQIDNPYVDATSNGLTHVIERFKGSPAAGHITLKKGERSELAELAARML